MYCGNCATRLVRKKNSRIVQEGDKEFDRRLGSVIGLGMDSYKYVTYTYLCPCCGVETTYDEQFLILKTQKIYRKKIVTKEEIDSTDSRWLEIDWNRLKKSRWLMMFPGIGGLVCSFLAFGSKASEKITNKELGILFFVPLVAVLFGTYCMLRQWLPLLYHIPFIQTYSRLITVGISHYAYNLATLIILNWILKSKTKKPY